MSIPIHSRVPPAFKAERSAGHVHLPQPRRTHPLGQVSSEDFNRNSRGPGVTRTRDNLINAVGGIRTRNSPSTTPGDTCQFVTPPHSQALYQLSYKAMVYDKNTEESWARTSGPFQVSGLANRCVHHLRHLPVNVPAWFACTTRVPRRAGLLQTGEGGFEPSHYGVKVRSLNRLTTRLGAPGEVQTLDSQVKSLVLFQLSYGS